MQVLFLLSGFLIAFVLDRAGEARGIFRGYLIDRFSRIYCGFLPAMLLIGAIDLWLISRGLHGEAHYATLDNWIGSFAMLNGYRDRFCPVVCVPNFGTAGHLWTLALEFHLYVFAGAVFLGLRRALRARPSALPLLVLAAAASVVPLTYASFAVAPGAGITWLWAAGFATFFVVKALPAGLHVVPLGLATVVLAAATGTTAVPGGEYATPTYLLLSLAFLGMVATTQRTAVLTSCPRLRGALRKLADFSFTLYLVHHSLVYLAFRLAPDAGWLAVWASCAGSLVTAWGMAWIGEARYRTVAVALKTRFGLRPRERAVPT